MDTDTLGKAKLISKYYIEDQNKRMLGRYVQESETVTDIANAFQDLDEHHYHTLLDAMKTAARNELFKMRDAAQAELKKLLE